MHYKIGVTIYSMTQDIKLYSVVITWQSNPPTCI